MLKSFFKKIILTPALLLCAGFILFSNPLNTYGATLSSLMTTLTATMESASTMSSATPASTLTSTRTSLDSAISSAKVQAQIELNPDETLDSEDTSIASTLSAQIKTALAVPEGTTDEAKAIKYLAVSTLLIQKTQVEARLVITRGSMLTIARAELVLAQLDRSIAQATGDSNGVTIANTRIGLAITAIKKAEQDLKTITDKIQKTSLDAKTYSSVAKKAAEDDVALKTSIQVSAQASYDAVKHLMNADPPDPSYVTALNALNDANAKLLTATNRLTATGTGTITTNFNTAQALYITAGDSALQTALVVSATDTQIKKETDASASAVLSAGEGSAVTDVASGDFIGSGASLAGSSSDTGGATSFDPGAFLGRAAAPCAATALASATMAWAAGAISAGEATAAGAITVPTTDPVGALSTGSTAGMQTYTKGFADCLIYTMGQLMIENLTEDIITWIKGGFDGKPRFATDLNSLLDGAEDIEGADLVRQLRGVALCDFGINFVDDLSDDLGRTNRERRNMFTDTVTCPFGEGSLINVTFSGQFYADFSQGGLKAYEIALSDSGNPFGLKVLTESELAKRKENAITQEKERRSWAKGFTDVVDTSDCEYPEGLKEKDDIGKTLPITNPDHVSASTIKQHERKYCKVITPGGLIASRLDQATSVDLERLGVADSLNKIIHQLITTLTTNAAKSAFKNI